MHVYRDGHVIDTELVVMSCLYEANCCIQFCVLMIAFSRGDCDVAMPLLPPSRVCIQKSVYI